MPRVKQSKSAISSRKTKERAERYYLLGLILFDLTLFSKINTCSTDNDVTYIIMPRIAQESSIYVFPLWSLVFNPHKHCGTKVI